MSVQWPVPSTVVVPGTTTLPGKNSRVVLSVIVLPASPVPVRVGSDVILSVEDTPVSCSSAAVTTGIAVSRVRATWAVAVLPAASVSVAVSVWAPSARFCGVKIQCPALSAVAVPSAWPASLIATVAFGSPSPVTAGSSVMPSVADTPVSYSSAAVTAGGAVSMVRASVGDGPETLPAASVSVADRSCRPLPRVVVSTDQVPSWATCAVPTTVVPSERVTVVPGSAVPVIVGVVTLVRSSPCTPLFEAGARVSPAGAPGGVVSSTRTLVPEFVALRLGDAVSATATVKPTVVLASPLPVSEAGWKTSACTADWTAAPALGWAASVCV